MRIFCFFAMTRIHRDIVVWFARRFVFSPQKRSEIVVILGSWNPGILESWDPGILGSCNPGIQESWNGVPGVHLDVTVTEVHSSALKWT